LQPARFMRAGIVPLRKRGLDADAAGRTRAASARPGRPLRLPPLLLCWLAVPGCDDFDPPDDPRCVHHELVERFSARARRSLDLLIWIDDSPSMIEEQELLAAQIPAMLRTLLAPDFDGDTRPDRPLLDDLHVGVVAPGAPTTSPLPGCLGPDGAGGGCLLQSPPVAASGCSATYPPFQEWRLRSDGGDVVERIAADLTCLASVGTSGCPFSQPFASVLRALTLEGGPGGCNRGFLRDDALWMVLWISDGDDGSASAAHPELFDPDAPLGPPELRAALHPELLEPVESFAWALRALAGPAHQDRILLGMVVGVPPDVPACLGPGDMLSECLHHPAMAVTLDPADPTRLIPSCRTASAAAVPPRRFVELAQMFGSAADVESICKSDWNDVLSPATSVLPMSWGPICLHHELPLAEGECIPNCFLVETLDDDRPCPEDETCPAAWCPPASAGDLPDPAPCTDPATGAECRPYKRDLGLVTENDGVARRRCLVRAAALAWDPATRRCGWPEEDGWFYRPPERSEEHCAQLHFLDTVFREGLEPGSRAELRCGWTVCDEGEAVSAPD